MMRRLFSSLYLKMFLSYLAIFILFFVGLALFWNFYFTDKIYEDKKQLLENRSGEIVKLIASFQEGTMSVRDLRFGMRLIARGFNGQAWIVDNEGYIRYSSFDREGKLIPGTLDATFSEALKGTVGYHIGDIFADDPFLKKTLTYYTQTSLHNEPVILYMFAPVEEMSNAISATRIIIVVPLLFSLIAVGVTLYILSRKLARPLQQMNQAAISLASGDFSARVPIRSEDEMGQLAKSFNFMVDQLADWEGSRLEFLANVSHELRSPLTTLRGLILAMNDKVIPADKHEHYLKICDGEVQRLQRLVNDLLDLARIQNGADDFRLSPVRLADMTRDVLEVISTQIEQKGLQLHSYLPEEGEPPIICMLDADRYAQIVQNLLYNAIRFTPSGKAIILSLTVDKEDAVIVVKDQGIGMNEDDLKRIWDRFYKVDESRGKHTDGTGLGLTIVKHLVNGMKGMISVHSEPGQGSEFVIRFPLYRESVGDEV